jgi:hypothetical protein
MIGLGLQIRPSANLTASPYTPEGTAMKAELQKEHEWLARFLGTWTVEMDGPPSSDQPAHPAWTETVRSLEGAWIVGEARGSMPDGRQSTTVTTLGFDSAKGRYVGTFIGSMMTHMWVYEGTVDASGEVLELDTDGPTFDGSGGTAKYKDSHQFVNEDYRILRSRALQPDGEWREFMVADYRRKS